MASGPPVVTGLSPKEGTPGTQITIRGENLGTSQKDLLGLRICGTDCLVSARWESSHKILARVGNAKGGPGEVIVYTKSGGKGSSSVSFRVFTKKVEATDESAVWVDEVLAIPGRQLQGLPVPAALSSSADPLGIADRAPSQASAQLQAALSSIYPEGHGNIKLEGFVPAWYLVANHQSAPLGDLRKGLEEMKKRRRSAEGGPAELIKSNLHSFLACVEALSSLSGEMTRLRVSPKGFPPTKGLAEKLRESGDRGEEVFSGVLRRKEDADATRSALSVLQRYRFLFFLPDAIPTALAQGDYASVLSEYERVRSLYGSTTVPLFKEALVEVDRQMKLFENSLRQKLCETSASMEEQKKIVRILSKLDEGVSRPEGAKDAKDAGWSCLQTNHRLLEGQMWDAQEKVLGSPSPASSPTPPWLALLHRLSTQLASRMREFWRLAQAYLSGQLGSQPSKDKAAQVEQKISASLNLASWLILNAIQPNAVPDNVHQFYSGRLIKVENVKKDSGDMIQALNTVRGLESRLRGEQLPPATLHPIQELCLTLRSQALQLLLSQATQDIHALASQEVWKLETKEDDRAATNLPRLAEARLIQLTSQLHDLLLAPNQESAPPAPDLRPFQQLMAAFPAVMESLTKLGGASGGQRPSSLPLEEGGRTEGRRGRGVKDKRLLMALCNVDFFRRFSLTRVEVRLRDAGLDAAEQLAKDTNKTLGRLEQALKEAYVRAKTQPIAAVLQSWGQREGGAEEAEGSREMKDALLMVVGVEAELFLLAPHLSGELMEALAEWLAKRVAEAVGAGRAVGAGVYVDASLLSEALHAHSSEAAKQALRLARHKAQPAPADLPAATAALAHQRDRLRLPLLGLQHASQSASV